MKSRRVNPLTCGNLKSTWQAAGFSGAGIASGRFAIACRLNLRNQAWLAIRCGNPSHMKCARLCDGCDMRFYCGCK